MTARWLALALAGCCAGAPPILAQTPDPSAGHASQTLPQTVSQTLPAVAAGPGPGRGTSRGALRETLAEALHREAPRLDPRVLALALDAADCARAQGLAPRTDALVVIDYSLPSVKKRLWVFDLSGRKLLFRELVAHGKGTGENLALHFSNTPDSKQTSLGLFVTGRTYIGRNGYSLRLEGLEEGVNDLAFERAIVMHGAWYVSEDFARQHGRLGRSWGCPALRQKVARRVIDRIKDGRGLIFSYAPDQEWMTHSTMLACAAGDTSAQAAERSAR